MIWTPEIGPLRIIFEPCPACDSTHMAEGTVFVITPTGVGDIGTIRTCADCGVTQPVEFA